MKLSTRILPMMAGCSIIAAFAFCPRSTNAQWVKSEEAYMDVWDENSYQEANTTITPQEGGIPSPANAVSNRPSGSRNTEGKGAYTTTQIYVWDTTYFGPPSPSFRITITAHIDGGASPALDLGEGKASQDVGSAGSSSTAGPLSESCDNDPNSGTNKVYDTGNGGQSHFIVTVLSSDEDDNTAYCTQNMSVESYAKCVHADETPPPPPPPVCNSIVRRNTHTKSTLPSSVKKNMKKYKSAINSRAKQAGVTYQGLANGAHANATLSFGDQIQQ